MAVTEPDRNTDDVVDILTFQHEQVKTMFNTLRDLRGKTAEAPFDDLRRMLAIHETAEEEIIYPALRAQGADEVVQARLAEEDEAKKALAGLEKMGTSAPEFPGELASFEKAVLAHATAEETEIFPRLRQEFDADRRRKMGTALMAAEAMAPTHAHKNAPTSGMGNMLVGPFVAMVDRVRDAIKEHTKSS
jgi:hemerythrin superfamily protein